MGFPIGVFGGLAATSGLQILTALIWRYVGDDRHAGRIRPNEPKPFRKVLTAGVVIFVVSTIFFVVVLLAVLYPPAS